LTGFEGLVLTVYGYVVYYAVYYLG